MQRTALLRLLFVFIYLVAEASSVSFASLADRIDNVRCQVAAWQMDPENNHKPSVPLRGVLEELESWSTGCCCSSDSLAKREIMNQLFQAFITLDICTDPRSLPSAFDATLVDISADLDELHRASRFMCVLL
jgi:hypothetical protein